MDSSKSTQASTSTVVTFLLQQSSNQNVNTTVVVDLTTSAQNYLNVFKKKHQKTSIDKELGLKLIDKYFYRLNRHKKYERDVQLSSNDAKAEEARLKSLHDIKVIRCAIGLVFPKWDLPEDSNSPFERVNDGLLEEYLIRKMKEVGRYYGDDLSDDSDAEDEDKWVSQAKTDRMENFYKIQKILKKDYFWKKNKLNTPRNEGLAKKLSELVQSMKNKTITKDDTIVEKLNKILNNLNKGPNTGPTKDKEGNKISGLLERARIPASDVQKEMVDQINKILDAEPITVEILNKIKKKYNVKEIYTAQYRGLNYMVDRWNADSRRHHRTMNEVNLPQYSEAVLKTLPYCFYTELNPNNDFIRVKQYCETLPKVAKAVQDFLGALEQTLPCASYSDKSRKEAYLFDSIGDRLQHRFSNGIDDYLKELHFLRTTYPDYWGSRLLSAHNPSVATGNTPYHALKYGYGLKDYYAHPFLPRYHKNGLLEYSHAGKFYASLHSVEEILTQPVKRVSHLDMQGRVSILRDIAPEKETSFLGLLPAGKVFYQYGIKYPSFHKDLKFIREIKYGLNVALYDSFKYLLEFSAPETKLREKILELLAEWLCAYHEALLVEIAAEQAEKLGGVLVYLTQDNRLSFTPDKNWFTQGEGNAETRIQVHAHRQLRHFCATKINQSLGAMFYGFRLVRLIDIEHIYQTILRNGSEIQDIAKAVVKKSSRADETKVKQIIQEVIELELKRMAQRAQSTKNRKQDEEKENVVRLSELLKNMKLEDSSVEEKRSESRRFFDKTIEISEAKEKQNLSILSTRQRHGLFEYQDTGDRIFAQKAKQWIDKHLAQFGKVLGTAYGKGDCFFDAVAIGLEGLKIVIPADEKNRDMPGYKKLRLLCYQSVKAIADLQEHWIKTEVARRYATYLDKVQYTASEIEERDVVWGTIDVDGRMVCEKLGIQLHLVEIRKANGEVSVIHTLMGKDGEIGNKAPDEIYAGDKTVHILNCEGELHFVPIVDAKQRLVQKINHDEVNNAEQKYPSHPTASSVTNSGTNTSLISTAVSFFGINVLTEQAPQANQQQTSSSRVTRSLD